jgi:hypothetical protein
LDFQSQETLTLFYLVGFAKGEKMHTWHDEFMAEFHRQDIVKEIEQIRLERLALKSRVYRPRLFERTMFSFANWMISTGKQLRKRYTRSSPVGEVPCVDCPAPTGSFAH